MRLSARSPFRATWSGTAIDVHPLLLDACFQVVAGARGASEDDTAAYMPFGWERLWLNGPLPERLVCRAQMRDGSTAGPPTPPHPRC